jgi:hypothetical protein
MTQPPNTSVEAFIKTKGFIEFIDESRRYCSFIENGSQEAFASFLPITQTYLQTLYTHAQKLLTTYVPFYNALYF